MLELFGDVISRDGAGVVIASQSSHRLPPLCAEQTRRWPLRRPKKCWPCPFCRAARARGPGYRRMTDVSTTGRAGTPNEVGPSVRSSQAPIARLCRKRLPQGWPGHSCVLVGDFKPYRASYAYRRPILVPKRLVAEFVRFAPPAPPRSFIDVVNKHAEPFLNLTARQGQTRHDRDRSSGPANDRSHGRRGCRSRGPATARRQ